MKRTDWSRPSEWELQLPHASACALAGGSAHEQEQNAHTALVFLSPQKGCKGYIFGTRQGWLYLAVVMDLYSRRIVGWSMDRRVGRHLVLDAVTMALGYRQPEGPLLHHSDRGPQYTSDDFRDLLEEHGIACSMSARGSCYDNAPVESFFSLLKRERIRRRTYPTRAEAKADVFDYIERFYNRRRRHGYLGYLSPVEFENEAMQT